MKRRRLVLVASIGALALTAPAGAAVSSRTIRLAIAHVAEHCHVWRTSTKLLGASTRFTAVRGTRLIIRADCPMDFDFVQTRGPRLVLGNPRTFAGSSRVLVFNKKGIYRLTATNVQSPEDRGLVTLGEPNHLTLIIVVK